MSHKNLKTSLLLIGVVILTLGLSISCQSLLAAWTAPTGNPTTCTTGNPGCDEPLNKGSFLQIKNGPLYVNSDQIAATGFAAYGNVGIGTVAPSTNLDVNGSIKSTNLTVFDTTPNVNYGVYGNKNFTDPVNGTIMQYLYGRPTYTGAETASENFSAGYFLNYPIINTDHTNSGVMQGLVTQVLRNSNGASADDNGTLTTMRGAYIAYGHNNTNAAVTPVTTNLYGLYIYPYQRTGTTTNMYDLFIANPVTGGDVTNQYGIYQQSASRNNYFAGNVGVGDGTPSYKLDVTGQINATGGLCIAGTCKTAWDTFTNYWTLSGANIYNNNTGNIGIGKTSPSYTLDVNGSIYGKSLYVSTPGGQWLSGKTGTMGINAANAQTTSAYFPVLRQTTSSGHVINLGGLGDNFGFYGYDANRTTNGTDYSFVMNLANGTLTASNNLIVNGNVGIGTTNPVSKLDLGTNYSDPSTYPNKITLWSSGANNYYGFGVSSGDLDYFSQGNHRFYTGYNGAAGTEKMVLTSAGNVGVGVTNPDSYLPSDLVIYDTTAYGVRSGLTILSSTTGLGDIAFADGSSGTDRYMGKVWYRHSDDSLNFNAGNTLTMTLLGGNVGIGTNAPASKLSVGGPGISNVAIYGNGSLYGIYGIGGSYGVYGSGPVGLYGNGSNTGVRGNGSSYGVYGTGPTGVRGDSTSFYGVYGYSSSASGYDIYGAGPRTYFAGNVGIGVGNPSAKLDISGQIKIVDGKQASGKVLASDANGLANWKNLKVNSVYAPEYTLAANSGGQYRLNQTGTPFVSCLYYSLTTGHATNYAGQSKVTCEGTVGSGGQWCDWYCRNDNAFSVLLELQGVILYAGD